MSHRVKIYSIWAAISSVAVIVLILSLFYRDSKEPTTILNSHFGSVTSIETLPDDDYFVSSAFDYKVKIWNLKDQKHIKTIDSNLRVVTDFASSKSRNIIYGLGTEGTFYMWGAESFEIIKILDPLYFPIEEIIVSEDEKYLAAKTADTVILFNLIGDTELSAPVYLDRERHDRVQNFFFRGKQLITVGSEGQIFFWDYESGEHIDKIITGREIRNFDLTSDGKLAVIGFADTSKPDSSIIELWNLEEKHVERTLGACKGKVLDILAGSFTDRAVVSCSESPLKVFQTDADGVVMEIHEKFKPGVRDLKYSESQDALIYRYADNIEIIWDFKSTL